MLGPRAIARRAADRLRRALALGLLAPLLAGICLALAAGAQGAQARPWRLNGDGLFLRENKLDASAATALVQDRQGFLWIGNQAGLLRWDGYVARSYAPDSDVPGALPDNYVSALLLDARGRLWVGTSNGGLARYDPEHDNFVTLPIGPGGLRDASVSALCDDGAGGLWVATGAGLDHVDGASGAIEALGTRFAGGRIEALLRDRHGGLWVGTSGGLAYRNAEGGSFVAQKLTNLDGTTPGVLALFEDDDGRIWAGTNAHGAYVREPAQARWRRVHEDQDGAAPMADMVKAIVQARRGEVWLGTGNGGVVIVDTVTWHTRRERHDETRVTSLASDEILSLYKDRDGWIWIGSAEDLCGFNPQPGAIDTYFGGSDPARLVAHNSVLSVLELTDGRIWLGLGEGGVQIIDPQTGRAGRVRADPHRPEHALPRGRVAAMAEAADGSIFLGTQAGLYRADPEGRRVTRVAIPGRAPTAEIRTLRFVDGTLWVGGRDGAWSLRVAPGEPARTLRHLESELGDGRVNIIEPDRDGGLWVGTFSGLAHIDAVSGTVGAIALDAEDKGRQRGWDVSSVHTDRDGRLWIGTFGRGIQVERGPASGGVRRFQRLTTRDGLPQNGIDMLLADAHGDIWASTDAGIARIDRQTLSVRVFRQAEGVGLGSFWTGSGAATADGELLFGGIGGLLVVHPQRVAADGPAPPLAVTDVHVGTRPQPAAALPGAAPLVLDADDRSLMVEFAALNYPDAEHQRYSYRLMGFDRDWVATPSSRRLATYTNLPPGRYTLQLRSAQAQGSWSTPTEIPVQVNAAWYQRDTVRGAGVLLLVAGIFGLVHLRTLYLRQRQSELQRLVAARTIELEQRGRELQSSHEELRRSQDQLEQMAYFDPLTSLPNRRMFNDDLRHLIARSLRGQGDFALVLVDLDGFKQINDQRGHQVGDALLVVVADRLRGVVRDSDRIARLGGDEFAVLLANASTSDEVEAMCARMVVSLREPMIVLGQELRITASLGIAPCPREGETPDALYRAADMALYEAKRNGRDTWRWSMAKAYTFTV